jgi:hypothetical protein
MKQRCLLLLLVVLVAVVACAEDAEAKLPLLPGEGMDAEPASPEDGVQSATKQLIAARCNVIAQLQQEMQQAASAMKFEDAARVREAINILTQGVAPKGQAPAARTNGLNLCPFLCLVTHSSLSLSLSRLEPVSCDSLAVPLRREIRSV